MSLYENRVKAVHFEKGKSYKVTEFMRIKILKPEGWQDPAPFLEEEMNRQVSQGSWS